MDKFFIVGCPRSGTTMVQQALNRHSQIVIPPETKYFFSFFGQSKNSQLRHLSRLNKDLGIDLPAPERPIATIDEGRDFYESMAQQYLARLGKEDVGYFGEKTPEHTGRLPLIRSMFPKAKIIVLYRDGRDVALSLSKVPWMSADLTVNFLVWLYYHSVIQQERDLFGSNLLLARYEDIVAHPERELRRIIHFLKLPYEPAVARGCGNRDGIPQREYAWKERALEKISSERVGLFRTEMKPDDLAILERLGRQALPSLGYELGADGNAPLTPSFFLKLAYHGGKLAYRLPWRALVKELACRLFPGRCAEAAPPPEPLGRADSGNPRIKMSVCG
jgi:hypothetical protein